MQADKKQGGQNIIVWTVLAAITLLILSALFCEASKAYWDYRVTKMCEEDGGVTVYEKVELTHEEYKKYDGKNGFISVPPEGGSVNVTGRFPYLAKSSTHILREFIPKIIRYESIIYRKSDKKELGKRVAYHRSGGDFPIIVLGYRTGFGCRNIPGFKLNIEQQIFSVKEN